MTDSEIDKYQTKIQDMQLVQQLQHFIEQPHEFYNTNYMLLFPADMQLDCKQDIWEIRECIVNVLKRRQEKLRRLVEDDLPF